MAGGIDDYMMQFYMQQQMMQPSFMQALQQYRPDGKGLWDPIQMGGKGAPDPMAGYKMAGAMGQQQPTADGSPPPTNQPQPYKPGQQQQPVLYPYFAPPPSVSRQPQVDPRRRRG